MSSQTALSFWDIPANLKYDEPIDEQSPFFVDTAEARGDFTYLEAAGEMLDLAAAQKAVKRLANDLRRILDTEDYSLLQRIDGCDDEINDNRVRHLLYNLALLEYNDYWRLTHPAVRTLDAYLRAAQP